MPPTSSRPYWPRAESPRPVARKATARLSPVAEPCPKPLRLPPTAPAAATSPRRCKSRPTRRTTARSHSLLPRCNVSDNKFLSPTRVSSPSDRGPQYSTPLSIATGRFALRSLPSATVTAPNAAFSPDPAAIGSNTLFSPVIPDHNLHAHSTFRNNYNLETDYATAGYWTSMIRRLRLAPGHSDGGWILWPERLQLHDQHALRQSYRRTYGVDWRFSADSSGPSRGNLPAAAAGQIIQLRWMCGSDNSNGDRVGTSTRSRSTTASRVAPAEPAPLHSKSPASSGRTTIS